MEFKGLAHIAVFTADMEGTLAFYERLGADCYAQDRVQKPTGENKLAMLHLAGFDLEIIEPHDGTVLTEAAGPIPHIALEVADLDAAIAELRALGIDTFKTAQPVELPKLFGGLRNIFFVGPNGEQLELLQHL